MARRDILVILGQGVDHPESGEAQRCQDHQPDEVVAFRNAEQHDQHQQVQPSRHLREKNLIQCTIAHPRGISMCICNGSTFSGENLLLSFNKRSIPY